MFAINTNIYVDFRISFCSIQFKISANKSSLVYYLFVAKVVFVFKQQIDVLRLRVIYK